MSLDNAYQNSKIRVLSNFNRHIIFIFLYSTCLFFTGCGGNNEEKPETTSENVTEEEKTLVEKVSVDEITTELQANKEKWGAHEITNYEIEMQKICFCPPDAVRLMIFEITDNEINSVRYVDSDDRVDPNFYDSYNTLNGLFELAEQALEHNPEEISIIYDDEYSYIKQISIDYKYEVADDEVTIITSSMRPN